MVARASAALLIESTFSILLEAPAQPYKQRSAMSSFVCSFVCASSVLALQCVRTYVRARASARVRVRVYSLHVRMHV